MRKSSVEREAAKAAGAKFYQGNPCRNGHDGRRYTSNSHCIGCSEDHDKARKSQGFKAGKRYASACLAALAAGEATFTGEPCSKGHSGARYVTSGECVECRSIRYDLSGRKKQRETHLQTYGLTSADYEAMATAQNFRCAVCGRPPNGRGSTLHVDHCHDTGAVRALLCHSCNTSLGHLNDDPATVLSLFYHLIKHGKPDPRCRVQSRHHHREQHAETERRQDPGCQAQAS